jgi:chitin disaccharide deacetylase
LATLRKYLIVNADDLGQSHAINAGVIRAHRQGIVTSASLMVRFPAALEAAELARAHPSLSVGLHFDLGEWAFANDEWRAVYTVADDQDEAAVEAEVESQLEAFRRLMGRDPTHIDSHQHVHRHGPVKSTLSLVAKELGVHLRGVSNIAYRGDFYGQTAKGEAIHQMITVESLIRFLDALLPGITELGCHPGLKDSGLDSMYQLERPMELRTLCSAEVRQAVKRNGIELRSFADLPAATICATQ